MQILIYVNSPSLSPTKALIINIVYQQAFNVGDKAVN